MAGFKGVPFSYGRRRIRQPEFRNAVRRCGRLGCEIAVRAGIRHHSRFSTLINAKTVPDTPITIAYLERICEAIGFDKARLFVDGAR